MCKPKYGYELLNLFIAVLLGGIPNKATGGIPVPLKQ